MTARQLVSSIQELVEILGSVGNERVDDSVIMILQNCYAELINMEMTESMEL